MPGSHIGTRLVDATKNKCNPNNKLRRRTALYTTRAPRHVRRFVRRGRKQKCSRDGAREANSESDRTQSKLGMSIKYAVSPPYKKKSYTLLREDIYSFCPATRQVPLSPHDYLAPQERQCWTMTTRPEMRWPLRQVPVYRRNPSKNTKHSFFGNANKYRTSDSRGGSTPVSETATQNRDAERARFAVASGRRAAGRGRGRGLAGRRGGDVEL